MSLSNNPEFFKSIGGDATQSVVEGGRKINQDFLRLVGYKDATVVLPKNMEYGDNIITTIEHGVTSGIPIVQMFLKIDNYYLECGFRDFNIAGGGLTAAIGNAMTNNSTFSFGAFNFDYDNAKTIEVRGYIYEILVANPSNI